MTGSAFIGSTTIDGKNYQQIGVMADIPIGKLGIGLDVKISIDSNGDLREEDWDDFEDYLNILRYVRWATKNDPFYLKVGALTGVRFGQGIIIDNYSNTIRYPDYKMIGLEGQVSFDKFRSEFFINNIKESFEDKSSVVLGTRLSYNLIGGLYLGGSIVSDLNQYNGLLDSDGDSYPDKIDRYPHNKKLVTEIDKYKKAGVSEETINELVSLGLLDGTRRETLFSKNDKRSEVTVFSGDISYQFFNNKFVSLVTYGEFAKIVDNGWGFTAPGVNANFGPINLYAEYRQSSDEFLFSYFDDTYELERSGCSLDENGNLNVETKAESLSNVPKMKGYFLGADFELFGIVDFYAGYQDLRNSDMNKRSIDAKLSLSKNLIPKISKAWAYYVQNNVENFKDIKTPSTVYGIVLGYNIGDGVSLDFNWRTTFDDINGNGKIDSRDEEIRSYGVSASMTF